MSNSGNPKTPDDEIIPDPEIIEGLEGEPRLIKKHGAYLLKAFTSELYPEPIQACREYISNSVDARCTEVRISCTGPNYDTLVIADDGEGMDSDELEEALNIMVSFKREKWDPDFPRIGRFGIGIYAGGKFSSIIRIKSKESGSSEVNTVVIPIRKWLEASVDIHKELKQVTAYTRYSETAEPFEIDKSYTVVTLEGLTKNAKDIMIRDEGKYFGNELGRIIPVSFPPDLQLEKSSLDDEEPRPFDLNSWLESILDGRLLGQKLHGQYNNVNAFYNGEPIHRPYQTHPVSEDYQEKKSFNIQVNGNDEPAAIGWAVARGPRIYTSKKEGRSVEWHGSFKKSELRGIQLRLLNVEVWSHPQTYTSLNLKLPGQPTGHWWGEIYIFHPEIKLNLTRKEFDENEHWRNLKFQITEWIRIDLLAKMETARKPKSRKSITDQDGESLIGIKDDSSSDSELAGADDKSGSSIVSQVEDLEIDAELEEEIESKIVELERGFTLSQRELNLIRAFISLIRRFVTPHKILDDIMPSIVYALQTDLDE